jgi:hypothetical protein
MPRYILWPSFKGCCATCCEDGNYGVLRHNVSIPTRSHCMQIEAGTQRMSMCWASVTNPKGCENDFLLLLGPNGGVPHLNGWYLLSCVWVHSSRQDENTGVRHDHQVSRQPRYCRLPRSNRDLATYRLEISKQIQKL